jgi:hypothetical protein
MLKFFRLNHLHFIFSFQKSIKQSLSTFSNLFVQVRASIVIRWTALGYFGILSARNLSNMWTELVYYENSETGYWQGLISHSFSSNFWHELIMATNYSIRSRKKTIFSLTEWFQRISPQRQNQSKRSFFVASTKISNHKVFHSFGSAFLKLSKQMWP